MHDLGDHRAGTQPGGRRRPAAALFEESIMDSRTTSKLVTFRRPFALSGLDGVQPPGTYTVRTEEEMLDTLSFVGWRRIGCTIVLHRGGAVEYAAIDPQDLSEALMRDDGQGGGPPRAPSVAERSGRRARDQLRRGGRQ
jgi:hypothetical protein